MPLFKVWVSAISLVKVFPFPPVGYRLEMGNLHEHIRTDD